MAQYSDEESARRDLITDALRKVETPRVHGLADLHAFLVHYYGHVGLEDVAATDPIDLMGVALSHRRAAQVRERGTAVVDVYTPTVDEHGWSNGHTSIEVVAGNMPFLVDSLSAALSTRGRSIHLVIHPTFWVRRDTAGVLLEVRTEPLPEDDPVGQDPADESVDSADDSEDRWRPESWIHIDIDRDNDHGGLERLRADLLEVLHDVRAALEDWGPMKQRAREAAERLASTDVPHLDDDERREAAEFMAWLTDRNYTFLGYREYDLRTQDDELFLVARPGTGLGLLREGEHPQVALRSLPDGVQQRVLHPEALVLTKANSRATVHRSAYIDYVGVKEFDDRGHVVGENRFLGLYTGQTYNQSLARIPVLRAKMAQVMQDSGLPPDSHMGKDLAQFLETYPRDEVVQAEPAELLSVALAVNRLQERRKTRVFLRPDQFGRFMSAVVYLPRDRYTTTVRRRIEAILRENLNGDNIVFRTRITESVLARLYFVVRPAEGEPLGEADVDVLQEEVASAVRSWDDDFREAALEMLSEEDAARVVARFQHAIPEAFKEAFPARTGVADIHHLDQLRERATEVNLYYPYGADVRHRRLKIYRSGQDVTLSRILPVLQDMGVEVTDERPFLIEDPEGRSLRMYDVGLVFPEAELPEVDTAKERFEAAFMASWRGRADVDRFNSLVLRAGLTWQEISILRAFAKYMKQGGTSFSQNYIENTLMTNAAYTRNLVSLFHCRFDPDHPADERDRESDVLIDRAHRMLDEINNLDVDSILRYFLTLILACVRTSYFRHDDDDAPFRVSYKFLPERIAELPPPRPKYEIWVYSPVVEGVHLRFSDVARGGLRWSDRPEDFRTEILGLVKAQAVKNAVIVPAGAKGGFFAKALPDPAHGREAWFEAGKRAYARFVSGMLEITDTRQGDRVVPPDRVVRHDDKDPYLVVAADKGTATFSDLANSIALERGYWLGDAFASGGSEGYDHKAMGITARGAWESVKRHFREMGRDTQSQDFTCVGIGDMSGDVFGNGMLLSRRTRLLAAFDHRHIFLDPDPDPETSHAERARLFGLVRSSWADYDHTLISAGGGVYSRHTKAIPISPQVRSALGLAPGLTQLTPPELIRQILAADVDLFWNGGIGTYVRGSGEWNSDVGDKANDAIRIKGNELRAKVVGEGGNLGLTQRGRIEAAVNGVRVNTDAIDNSAGVDTSDHEVNIKILLDSIVRAGDLTTKQRNALLHSMTDTVAELVLRHNYHQNAVLGNGRTQASSMFPVHVRMMQALSASGVLDRDLEALPDDQEVEERQQEGGGLTSPELSVLLAYAKMSLSASLEDMSFTDDTYFQPVLNDYFPDVLRERYDQMIPSHPLAEEIIRTSLVSDLINLGGITFAFRMQEETSASPIEIVRGFTFAKDVFDVTQWDRRIHELDNLVSTDVQFAMTLDVRRLLDRAARWFIHSGSVDSTLAAEVGRYRDRIATLGAMLPDIMGGAERERMIACRDKFVRGGVPQDLALEFGTLLYRFTLLDVVRTAERIDTDPEQMAQMYYAVSERFNVDEFLTRISALKRTGRWTSMARQALRSDLYLALSGLTAAIVQDTEDGQDTEARLDAWESEHRSEVSRVRKTLEEISELDQQDFAALSVVLRSIRTLVHA